LIFEFNFQSQAILAGHLDEFKGKKVVLLVCGGNIDTTTFGRCLERGLAGKKKFQTIKTSLTFLKFLIYIKIEILTFTSQLRVD
jgi:hypothetical protein